MGRHVSGALSPPLRLGIMCYRYKYGNVSPAAGDCPTARRPAPGADVCSDELVEMTGALAQRAVGRARMLVSAARQGWFVVAATLLMTSQPFITTLSKNDEGGCTRAAQHTAQTARLRHNVRVRMPSGLARLQMTIWPSLPRS